MYKSSNPYRPVETEVIDVITETPAIKTFRLQPSEPFHFDAGQFIEFTVPGIGEAPFTPSSNPAEKDRIEITVMKVGRVTGFIHQLKKGDRVGLRGPFGTKYPIDTFKGKQVLIVGGGCGFAPLRSLIYEFFNRLSEFEKVVFRGGCKTPSDFLYRKEIESWKNKGDIDVRLTVDNGDDNWKENVGVVTTILDNSMNIDCPSAIAVVCGPPIMMKFSTKRLLELGFRESNLYLSMEKNMSCGIGKCGHCRVGTFYACKDGPVFSYDKLKNFHTIWE
ncbi:MAG: FAD/NAD(P)-binding protein [Spirochaetales bacterium]|nr:FAD/NAD(P)-binding protein [Spirochaetales bacterium]